MAVTKYEKDGQVFWQVYVGMRSRKHARGRVQKRVTGITSEREAIALEKRLLRDLSEKLTTIESKGAQWGELIERWARHQELYPTRQYAANTVPDYVSMLNNWTKPWLNRVASEISRADGCDVIRVAEEAGKSASLRKTLKYTINQVYRWGIEQRLIAGALESPVHGLEVTRDREEKRPEILTAEEIRELLRKAKEQNNPWYPTWVGAVLTGCRSGELHQLKRSDLEVVSREQAIEECKKSFEKRRFGFLRVRKSWNTRAREAGPTKAGYWRNVPVSSEFYWVLVHDLGIEKMSPNDFIFPRAWEWDKGEQARVLRAFCIGNKLPSVRFHALRACFATQLISTGIPATVVMKICGWRDLKTMQRYIRLAGIDEAGATEVLRFVPTEEAVMEKVVSIYDHRRKD